MLTRRRRRAAASLAYGSSVATFALVHGSWHGPWCWEHLAPMLEAKGHRVVAVDLRGDDWSVHLTDTAAIVDAAVVQDTADLIVVGHSLGGITIPLVAMLRPVLRLSFVCALIPRPKRSLDDVLAKESPAMFDPRYAALPRIRHADGSASLDPETARFVYYHDCTDDIAARALSNLRPQVWTTGRDVSPLDEWPDVESQYIVCRDDRALRPEWSRRRARDWLGVEPVELDGGHSPMLSRPRELAASLTTGL
jgi:pimeloyl-ACP methyl ester carboxylesterase